MMHSSSVGSVLRGAGMDDLAFGIPLEPPADEPRELVCEMQCPTCQGPAKLYRGDPRSAPWLRVECDAGHWGDLGPESALIPEAHRRPEGA